MLGVFDKTRLADKHRIRLSDVNTVLAWMIGELDNWDDLGELARAAESHFTAKGMTAAKEFYVELADFVPDEPEPEDEEENE